MIWSYCVLFIVSKTLWACGYEVNVFSGNFLPVVVWVSVGSAGSLPLSSPPCSFRFQTSYQTANNGEEACVCLSVVFTLTLLSQWGKPSKGGSSHFSWAPFRRSRGTERERKSIRSREAGSKIRSLSVDLTGCTVLTFQGYPITLQVPFLFP